MIKRARKRLNAYAGLWTFQGSLYSNAVMSFTLPSFAKINLYLRVLGKRPDGFHEIVSVFQTISLHDEIRFEEADDIELHCNDPRMPLDEGNLIIRAARLLSEHSDTRLGANIKLTKRIPSPGGLGGGSSNAAVSLIGLCRLWKIDPEFPDLLSIAEMLGSDVPFFLSGGTAVCSGRGNVVRETRQIEAENILIATPDVSVPTPLAYAQLRSENLTSVDLERILIVCRSEAELLSLSCGPLRNDLEEAVFGRFPEVGKVKEKLLELGAASALMCGSGPSVFAVFDNTETRQSAMKALDDEVNWRKFAVAAVSRDEYREAVGIGY
ncbi:MAG TPA: 4-(cytidine 5'-diphospho)-2-C-methyl-D-erythritol kinase [Pyrinomonadaceae bacterium]|nr:4-(cytidine 5'-diphospho)-2-C-methyl-D-erythritol kinase [Pyrinomonadaceae bacterium]